MCVKLLCEDLNPDIYPLHPTNAYNCKVTLAQMAPQKKKKKKKKGKTRLAKSICSSGAKKL